MEKKYAADAKIPLKQKVKNILRKVLLRKNNGGGYSNVKNVSGYGMLFTFDMIDKK